MIQRIVLTLSLLAAWNTAQATDIYVSPNGNDRSAGTKAMPLATLAAAAEKARPLSGQKAVTVHVADGVYYLSETLVFRPEDSGSAKFPITYRAENEGRAVLSGGSRLELTWKPHKDGIYQAKTPAGLVIDQLFVEGRNQRMARYPNFDPARKTDAYQGFAADAFSRERARRWADPAGGYIHAMHAKRWGGYHYRITGKDSSGNVTYEGGWQNNRQMGMHKDYRMVENIFEELDAPGEWFHNADEQTLYYLPPAGIALDSARVEVVRLRHLIEFQGSESSPVKFINLKGFVVRHAARTFMDTKEPLLRSDWTIYRGGAIFLTGTEDVQILDTEFDQVGGNAIFASDYNRRILVKGCHVYDAGASGVCLVGDPDAVRDPLFEYQQKNDLAEIDRTPGPRTSNYPAGCSVADCLIRGIGRVERQPAGVLIQIARRINVRDCSIYDCARAGINIGDGAWGGHLIERCDVFDTVQETHDHGSFNSWGRDRYWRSDHLTASQQAVDADPQLPFLDAMETTVIRNSRWRCDHGWDIDLDDGSSNYDIYNNLLLSGGLKLREGFRRRAWNNIAVNNGFLPHVWFNNSGDEVFSNIFMAAHRGARMPSETAKGKRVDGNLFYSPDPAVKDRFVRFGWDVNSVAADPQFIDPAVGDFRVKEGSPALEVGFRNFPMDQFGVKKPALREIAETPVIPAIGDRDTAHAARHVHARSPSKRKILWLGATMDSLEGDEYSAFGVTKEAGGVKVSHVNPNSDAARIGLRDGDLVQGLNGKPVKHVAALLKTYCFADHAPLSVTVIRNQEAITLKSHDAAYVSVETAGEAAAFSRLILPSKPSGTVSAKPATNNSPVNVLTDGRLEEGYGPVFANRVLAGVYRMDLGKSRSVSAITSWSANQGARRGPQRLTIYGSNSTNDPGWSPDANSTHTPLASIDTTSRKPGRFNAVSLRARSGQSLGTFRWIYWQVDLVSELSENTAFQELHVESAAVIPLTAQDVKPNVIIVMTDDQGYGDLGCHGNPVLKTPNLDALSRESIRFTDFHVSPFCTPTRAALMTGNHPGFTGAYRTSSGRTMMHRDEKTIANLFGDNGYATGMVGKWHLGDNAPHRPQDRGFQDVVWHRCGGVGQASDYWGNDYFDDTYERNGKFEKFEGYCTDVWFREGIRFIEENKDTPFFLYLPTNAPHGPYLVPDKWAKPYVGNKDVANANFYGMIANIDHNIGILRRRLHELGLAENTILIFMTDNGTAGGGKFRGLDSEPLVGYNAGMRGKKASVYDGGHRVPFFIHWPKGGLSGGKDVETLAAHIDVLPTLADLCDIPVPDDFKPDGVSLKPLLYESDPSWARDHHVIQYHGGAGAKTLPSKPFEYTVVMTQRWRLVNSDGQRLYDIQADPAQRHNVAEKHPEVVARLRAHYQPFWDNVSPRLTPVRIDVGNPAENPTVLCSQDWYMPTGNPPWNFKSISRLPRVTGPWMLEVKQAGRYRITLRQFPKEANKPIVAERAKIEIAGQTVEQPVKPDSTGVVFNVDLPAGPAELTTWLYDKNGKVGGAYFTEVEAL